ncbi:MAG: NADH-quinone oxidoreductase subunit, partial [Frankiales bacterium]|nr:NADH-quinone oxidoreductase subunit [Frankiales bacterium]
LIAPAGALQVLAGTRFDSLAAVVAVMVGVVALAVQVYSVGYLHDDLRYPSYAAQVSLFTSAMLLVVVASDLLELLVGWEVMGLCSYLLIGHYRELDYARRAAVKAFLVTRIGDVGMLLGVAVLGTAAGTTDIGELLAAVPRLPHGALVAGSLLLLLGVAGKSAQFPLHVWLPDAMAGPTPISALIHAATMVAAGVYLVARLHPLFLASTVTLDVLALMAAVTMLLGALAAFAQDDLKRLLAWSTTSQLAYMLGALAAGGYDAGLLHLMVHASAKALLFLAAGLVLHAVHTGALSQMRGVARRMPVAALALIVGGLTLAGLPPFAGAWSKDSVLAAMKSAAGGSGPGPDQFEGVLLYLAGLATVLITAAYVARLLLILLAPPAPRGDLHEPRLSMAQSVTALTVTCGVSTFLALPDALPSWLPAPAGAREGIELSVGGVTLTAIGVLAVFAALWLYSHAGARDPVLLLGSSQRRLRSGFGVDALYDRGAVRPTRSVAAAVAETDASAINHAVEGIGRSAVRTSSSLRVVGAGRVRSYLAALIAGVLLVVVSVAVVV